MKMEIQYDKTYGIVLYDVHSFSVHVLSDLKGN